MVTENPTRTEVDATLRNIDSLVEQVGDKVVDDLREETENGVTVKGRKAQRGQSEYKVYASQAWPFVQLQARFNAVEAVAFDRARAASPENGQPPQLSTDDLQQVREDIREAADGDMEEIRQGLIDRIVVPGYGTDLASEGSFATGFAVTTKLFPYEETPTAKEFEEAVQGVLSLRDRGQLYLVTEYGLEELVNCEKGDTPRGFQ